jgi:outer membrane protein OmpA-like peptidoglycan-associated protein
MRRELDETGHVSLYGILFDTNSADIQPASEPMLAEIAEFLATNARVKLYVVGHTDNTGGFEHNMRLSKERAAAVVEALESRHRVSPDRLQPVGVGPVAPVGSNQTDEGRAKNRRVELVHQ